MFNFIHYNYILSEGSKEILVNHHPSRWPACELSSESRPLLEGSVCGNR
jgi:hypothetical protein